MCTCPFLMESQPNPTRFANCKKSLYGLKQRSRKWYAKLSQLLIQERYHQSISNYSLFTLKQSGNFTALLVYVDNIQLELHLKNLLESKTSQTKISRSMTLSPSSTVQDQKWFTLKQTYVFLKGNTTWIFLNHMSSLDQNQLTLPLIFPQNFIKIAVSHLKMFQLIESQLASCYT